MPRDSPNPLYLKEVIKPRLKAISIIDQAPNISNTDKVSILGLAPPLRTMTMAKKNTDVRYLNPFQKLPKRVVDFN
jgi:hypothetical protein